VPSAKKKVIYPIYDTEAVRRGGKTKPEMSANGLPVVGFMGALSPLKAPHGLISAAQKLISKGFKARFLFVGGPLPGEEDYARKIKKLPEKLGISKYFHFTGFQNNPFSWLNHFDVFVITSLQDSCPLVVFEAMDLGKPVIGTNVGGIPEQVLDGETGFIVPPGNPSALAEKLQILIESPVIRRQMGDAGRKRVTSLFTPVKISERLFSLYRDILSNHNLFL